MESSTPWSTRARTSASRVRTQSFHAVESLMSAALSPASAKSSSVSATSSNRRNRTPCSPVEVTGQRNKKRDKHASSARLALANERKLAATRIVARILGPSRGPRQFNITRIKCRVISINDLCSPCCPNNLFRMDVFFLITSRVFPPSLREILGCRRPIRKSELKAGCEQTSWNNSSALQDQFSLCPQEYRSPFQHP